MTMVRGEDFSKEVAFARKHKSRVLQIFLDSGIYELPLRGESQKVVTNNWHKKF